MAQPYSITVDLSPTLYGNALLLANAQGKSVNQLVVEALESLLQTTNSDCQYPECPIEPTPDWDNHSNSRRGK